MRLRDSVVWLIAVVMVGTGNSTLAQQDVPDPPSAEPTAKVVPSPSDESLARVDIEAALVELRPRTQEALEQLAETLPVGDALSADFDRTIPPRIPGDALDRWRGMPGLHLDVVSRPSIRTLMGVSASIQVGNAHAVQYLVRGADGTFLLRERMLDLGVQLFVLPQRVENDPDRLSLQVQVEIRTLDGRESLPGVNLDVGEPIFSARSLMTTIILKQGEMQGIKLPGPEGRLPVVFLKARVVEQSSANKPDKVVPNPLR